MARKSSYHSGMTGVFYVAAQLSQRNYLVGVTVGNAPHVDLVVGTHYADRKFSVQVKTNSKGGAQSYWLLSAKAKTLDIKNHFYIFVNLKAPEERPDFYVVPNDIVARDIDVGVGGSKGWYSFKREETYLEKWDVLNS